MRNPGASWRILLADDDVRRRDALATALAGEGFEVDLVDSDHEAVERFAKERHDLVMIGSALPTHGGPRLSRTLRGRSDVPIIMVTATRDETDVVAAFEGGADDCITEPLRTREVVARVRAALRRAPQDPDPWSVGSRASGAGGPGRFEIDGVRLDAGSFEVTVRGERVEFPLKEFEVLALLMANAGRTLTRRVLIDRVWDVEPAAGSKTLDAHIRRIRAKVEDDPSIPTRIVTIRGLGYRYNR